MAATVSTITTDADATSPTMGWPRALVLMTRPTQIALILVIFASGVLLGVEDRPPHPLDDGIIATTRVVASRHHRGLDALAKTVDRR